MKTVEGLNFIAPSALWQGRFNLSVQMPEAALKKTDLPLRVEKRVAMIGIRGVMQKFTFFMDESSTVKARLAVQSAANDKRVDSIMLVMDTPGGSVAGLAELGDAVYKARQSKPVVAQVDGMTASAGYWVASQASAIYAHSMDLVGSIGVIRVVRDLSKMAENQGVKVHVVSTGEHKGDGIPGAEVTEAQLEHTQHLVDTFHAKFLDTIVRGRANMTMDALKPLSDGRMFVGSEAVTNGLIDGIQTFEQTFAQLIGASQSTPMRERAELEIDLALMKT